MFHNHIAQLALLSFYSSSVTHESNFVLPYLCSSRDHIPKHNVMSKMKFQSIRKLYSRANKTLLHAFDCIEDKLNRLYANSADKTILVLCSPLRQIGNPTPNSAIYACPRISQHVFNLGALSPYAVPSTAMYLPIFIMTL